MASRSLSWTGRINTIQMVIVPKIIYKFQMLPIPLPQTYFITLKNMISKFIWQNSKPRISFSVLKRDKVQGGIKVPKILQGGVNLPGNGMV